MEKRNHFTENFSKKADSELQDILTSENHITEAKQAATWELEKRKLQPISKFTDKKTPLPEKPRYRMPKEEKQLFKWRMLVTGIAIIGIGIYFNYETLFITDSSLKTLTGQVEYSKTFIEQVSSRSRYGTISYSNKATLEIKLFEHPKPFRIYENIGQSRIHEQYNRITGLLTKRKTITLLTPDKPVKYGPEFFELNVNGKTEISIESLKSKNYFSFSLLVFFGAGLIYLSTRTDWAERIRGIIRE